MNPTVLAGILKRVYKKIDMSSFQNRLKIQKSVYLLQAWGINLDYDFNFYLQGPYSTELTKDAFQMPDFTSIDVFRFPDEATEKKLEEFIEFIEPHKDDIEWLKIAASLHLLNKLYSTQSKQEIIKRLVNLKFVNEKKTLSIWDELVARKLVKT